MTISPEASILARVPVRPWAEAGAARAKAKAKAATVFSSFMFFSLLICLLLLSALKTRQAENTGVSKQRCAAAGVQENDVLHAVEIPLADLIDQAVEPLARIDRVKQEPFEPGQLQKGLAHALGRQPVAWPYIIAIRPNRGPVDFNPHSKVIHGLAGQIKDHAFLFFLRCPNADPEQMNIAGQACKACHQARLGAGASGGMDQRADLQPHRRGLFLQFGSAIHIAQCANAV
mmetsp:Transcript_7859/g.10246  ORF Transcript_7859/g.10246 Transcript_7859/m.10246 type:complete len:231 (-) Transcript_7859:547-1239(-)